MDGPLGESDRTYGPPRITLLPRQHDDDAPPTLHTSRVVDHTLSFHTLKPAEQWYTGCGIERQQQLTWRAQRDHKRWLRASHPEAAVGLSSELMSDLFDDDTTSPTASRRPLLAIGQMTDMTLAKSRRPRAILATASGASGELLRLTSLRRAKWHWDDHTGDEDPVLRLLRIDAADVEDTALWSQDDSPICQIKVALDLAKQDPSRYVLVQKKMCTTVLKPQYRRLPVPGQGPYPDGGNTERPSRVEPKPVLTISSAHTGGHPHSDMAYNRGSAGKPEQLAIIDERGFWTVWDMQGKIRVGSLDFFPRLRYCGHIQSGILEHLPVAVEATTAAIPHGILWVGPKQENQNHWDAALYSLDEPRSVVSGASHRSRTILAWNRTSLVLVNLEQQTSHDYALPLLRLQKDRILDVQLSPANLSQAFVLTSTSIFWIDLLPASVKQGVKILVSCAHLRGTEHGSLAFTVNHGWHELGDDASVVCIHASNGADLDAFVFSTGAGAALPQFQHHKIRIPHTEGMITGGGLGIQSLCLAPALLDVSKPDPLAASPPPPPQGPGAAFMKRNDRFWQLLVFDEAFGLQASLVAATAGNGSDLQAPDLSLELSRRKQWRAQKRRRTDVIRQLAETFVIPDVFGDLDGLMQAKLPRPGRQSLLQGAEEVEDPLPRWPRRGAEGITPLANRVGISIESVANEVLRIRSSTAEEPFANFELVHRALMGCLSDDEASLTLKTLREYERPFEAPPFDAATEGLWDLQLGGLIDVDSQRVVMDVVLPSFLGLEINNNTSIAVMRQHIEGIWGSQKLSPAAQQSRNLAIAEVTEAALRSLYAFTVVNLDASKQFDGLKSWVPEPDVPESNELIASQRSPYLTPRQSQSPSRPSSQLGSSQMAVSSSQEGHVPSALHRLSMLAVRLNTSRQPPASTHPVLSFWPERRGIPTSGYQSSVQMSSTQRLVQIRKAQRAESRRRPKRTRITSMPNSSADPTAFSSQGLPPLRTEAPAIRHAPPPVFASDGPTTGFAPRRPLIPDYAMSSRAPGSSQTQGMGLAIMSQPVPGQHGNRPQQAKKKRKGGF